MDEIKNALTYIGVDEGDFSLRNSVFKRPNHKPIHGIGHIYRTMIGCALIGYSIKRPREALLAFCGAFIHDLARCTDGDEPEHGENAVTEYFDCYSYIWNKYGFTPQECDKLKLSVKLHSRSEKLTRNDWGYEVAAILKDADALDRCRLRDGLNPNMLYFNESKSLIPISKQIFEQTREINSDISFIDFIQQISLSIQSILDANRIDVLYHFTDRSNLLSIFKHNGLFSWKYCEKNNIKINKPGGIGFGRNLDEYKGIEDYVHLSFCRTHPMMYAAQHDNRIKDPVIIQISTDVCKLPGTLFSNINATANGVKIIAGVNGLSSVDLEIVKRNYSSDFTDDEKAKYQAEVLVKEGVSLKYFLNLDDLYNRLTNDEKEHLRKYVLNNIESPSIITLEQTMDSYIDEKVAVRYKATNCTKVIINDNVICGTEGIIELDAGTTTCKLIAENEVNHFGECVSKSIDKSIKVRQFSTPILDLTCDRLYIKKDQENSVNIYCGITNAKSATLFVGTEQIELPCAPAPKWWQVDFIGATHQSSVNKTLNLSQTTNIYISAIGLDNIRRFKSKMITIEGRYEAQIKLFSADKQYSIPDVPFLISWDVAYADKVYMLANKKVVGSNLAKQGQGYYTIDNRTQFTLFAEDVFGMKQLSIELDMLPKPSIKYVSIPVPEVERNTTLRVSMNTPHLRESSPKIIGAKSPMFTDKKPKTLNIKKVDYRGNEHKLINIIKSTMTPKRTIIWKRLCHNISSIINRIIKTN